MITFDIEIGHINEPISEHLVEKHKEAVNFMAVYNYVFCISMGFQGSDGKRTIKSLRGDERGILEEFFRVTRGQVLCGYNILGFDLPFILQRAMILGVKVPPHLRFRGKKPWDLDSQIVDIARVFQGTGLRMTSLEELCLAMRLANPKDMMHGDEVNEKIVAGKGDEVVAYCERDVNATMDIYYTFVEI